MCGTVTAQIISVQDVPTNTTVPVGHVDKHPVGFQEVGTHTTCFVLTFLFVILCFVFYRFNILD